MPVTIPKEILGIRPGKDVEFLIVDGSIVVRKIPKKPNLAKWKGRYARSFSKLGYSSVNKFIEDIRGR